jgi:EmrB/QacA subfamily drug resistance transporter
MDERRRKLITLVLCCIGQFMVILDVSVVNVALPSIKADLGFSGTDLQWVVNAYTLTFAGFLLLGGRAADLLGRRAVFTFGLLLFAVASLVGGLAPSGGLLVAARALQGVGGAVVAPASLSIITSTFTEGGERNKAVGAWGAMGGVGGASGSILGGVLTQGLSWRWILFINVPIGLISALLTMRVVQAARPEGSWRRNLDVAGALSVTAGLVVLTYGIVRTDVNGWGSTRSIVTFAIAAALLALSLFIEARVAVAPLLPLRLFRSRHLSSANFVVFMLGCSAFAMWYFVSLYLQQVLGYSPIEAGLAFLPMASLIAVASTFSGRVAGRIGAGPVLAVGMGMIAAGMLIFGRVPVDGTYVSDVLLPSFLVAIGIGLAFVPVTIAAMAGVEPREQGVASGLVNTSRQVGGSLGLAVLATVATERTSSLVGHESTHAALTSGFHHAFVLGAIFAGVGALTSVFGVPRVRRRQPVAAEA